MKKRILSLLLAVSMLASMLLTTTAQAANVSSNTDSSTEAQKAIMLTNQNAVCQRPVAISGQTAQDVANGAIEITRHTDRVGKSFECYSSREAADRHPITLYASGAGDFPLQAKMTPYGGYETMKFKIESYGTHRKVWINFWGSEISYVTIIVKKTEPVNVLQLPKTSEQSESTAEEILDQKWQTLLDQIQFPFIDRKYSPYVKEVRAYLTGEWDGSDRVDDGVGWGGYSAARYVMGRTYYWIASNCINGKGYTLSTNVDYVGYKEVIPGMLPAQKYSLAASYLDGVIEKWSLLEKQDEWKIDAVAEGRERIDYIIPLATESSKPDDAQAVVQTVDADGQSHHYSLLPDGKVQ